MGYSLHWAGRAKTSGRRDLAGVVAAVLSRKFARFAREDTRLYTFSPSSFTTTSVKISS